MREIHVKYLQAGADIIRLNKHEQIMLFLNKRGTAGFVSCRSCGYVMKCPHCDVSMTLHRNGKLVCHYCGYETHNVSLCPECGSKYILGFKAGTEAVEDAVKKMFPAARVLRMDMDTTKGKGGHENILSAFATEQADILIGTQMIVRDTISQRLLLSESWRQIYPCMQVIIRLLSVHSSL